jgi:hypothetical protein
LTLDVFIVDRDKYNTVKESNVLNPEHIGCLYKIDPRAVKVICYDEVCAFKITFPRLSACGSIEDTDVYGAQQHAPLLDIVFYPEANII